MDLDGLSKKLAISRAAQYYYQDIRLHLELDKFENKHEYGKYPRWDDIGDTLKKFYLKNAIEALRQEGKL